MDHIQFNDKLQQLYDQQIDWHRNYHAYLQLLQSQIDSSLRTRTTDNNNQDISTKVRNLIERNNSPLINENNHSGDLGLKIAEKKKSAVRAIIEGENDIER